MKIRQLRLFADVCDEGSLSGAAKRNGMSVQNVSKAMSDLEGELGRTLFDRSGRGARPTDAARALLPYARTALKAFELCESFGSSLRGPEPRPRND
ncbi:LysR family transcriptional regulator [Raoultibacter phocaeensis]|uniref:LysR family transcriptional regulator n=1 Tax=Raoultibacter phocaeensis TaxID=2479841 RepID=UPI00111A5476|nr:LysR family transcriptional regulator [Raoultibacter phocaeensis]